MPGSQGSQFQCLYGQLIFIYKVYEILVYAYRCCAQQTVADVRRCFLQGHETW